MSSILRVWDACHQCQTMFYFGICIGFLFGTVSKKVMPTFASATPSNSYIVGYYMEKVYSVLMPFCISISQDGYEVELLWQSHFHVWNVLILILRSRCRSMNNHSEWDSLHIENWIEYGAMIGNHAIFPVWTISIYLFQLIQPKCFW